jgi:hypothetical protein
VAGWPIVGVEEATSEALKQQEMVAGAIPGPLERVSGAFGATETENV